MLSRYYIDFVWTSVIIGVLTSMSVRARTSYTGGTLQALRGHANGKEHKVSIARNQDRAIEAVCPEEAIQCPHQPIAEARISTQPNRRRVVDDCGRRQGRELDEEVRDRR